MSRTFIQTFTGRRFYFDRLEENETLIDDIAHALALVNRFGGHTVSPYSVAQHSVIVSRLVAPQYKLQALLHDAHEAYIGDVVRAMKEMFPQIRDLQHLIDEHIFAAFNVNATPESTAVVKLVDNQVLATEASQLLSKECDWLPEWDLPEPLSIQISPWDWKRAEQAFLAEFLSVYPVTWDGNKALVTEGSV